MPVSNLQSLLGVTYIGGPTILLEVGGLRILTDPTFDRADTRYERLHKLSGPAVRAEKIGPIDAVLLSHDQHFDNLDNAGRTLLGRVNLVATTPSAAEKIGANAKGLAPWESMTMDGPNGLRLRVTATPARHGPPDCQSYMGEVTGFVLSWSEQPRSAIYISGDTVFYEEVAQLSERFSIGIAVLHMGDAHVAARGSHRLTMNAAEAVEAAAALNPHTVIPVHYEGWDHFRESKSHAQRVFTQSLLRCRVLWLEPGIRTVFRP